MEKWKKIQFFLKEQFLNLIKLIEKNVMLKVHGEFNSLFKKWFSMIVASDLLNVKLNNQLS